MKTGGTKVPLSKPSNNTKFEDGDTLICVKSASPAYKSGKEYQVYKNDKGWKCMKGEDGLEDIMSMMVSSFKIKG